MTAAHYKGGHPSGNDLGLHYTALPPIVASCPYSDQLLVTRKFWSPGANRPSQARRIDEAMENTRSWRIKPEDDCGERCAGDGAAASLPTFGGDHDANDPIAGRYFCAGYGSIGGRGEGRGAESAECRCDAPGLAGARPGFRG